MNNYGIGFADVFKSAAVFDIRPKGRLINYSIFNILYSLFIISK